jgi:hypothetical protein
VLERLPRALQQQPLLGIHGQRLARADREELGVELGRAVDEAAVARVARAEVVGVRVVQALDVPPAIARELADRVDAARHQLPQLVGGGDAAGQPAAHADDRDRLVEPRCGSGSGRRRRPLGPARLAEQERRDRRGRRVVEDEGRRKLQAAGLDEPVLELDGRERVEAQLLERAPGVDRVSAGVPEDGRRVSAHDLQDHRGVLWLRHAGEPVHQRAADSPPGGRAHEAAQQRREHPRACLRAEGGGVERHGDEQRLGRGARGVEELEPALGRQRRHALAAQPGAVGVAELAAHAAGLLPQPPRDRARREPLGPAVVRERVEEGVRRRVVRLPGAAERRRRRGEEDELRQLEVAGQLVQVQSRVELRLQHPVQALCVERIERAVVEHPGGMDNRAHRMLGEQRRELVAVGGVARGDGRLAAELGERRDELLRAVRFRAAAADQQQPARAVHLGEMPRDERAQPSRPAGDQDRALGVERRRDGEDELADVAPLTQEAERARRVAHVEARHRRALQRPALEQRDQLREHLRDPVGAGLEQVEGAVLHALASLGDLVRVADVGLAHLEEAPAARQQVQRRVDELPGQRVQHDVDAVARERLAELERARRRDPLRLDAEAAQRPPLAGARRREHLGADVAGDLRRRHPDAARGGVDQDPLAPLQAGQVGQRVVRGEERERHRRRLDERPAFGDRHERAAVGHADRAERVRDDAHHPIADREVLDPRADLEHDPRRLAAERRLTGVHPERDQHVAEVQPRRAHPDPHLARRERRLGARAASRREPLQRPRLADLQMPRTLRLGVGLRAHQPRDQQLAVAHRDLRLLAEHAERLRERGRRGVAAVEIDQREAIRMLGVRRPDQPRDRRGRERRCVSRGRDDRSAREEHEARAREHVGGDPPPAQLQRPCGARTRGAGEAGAVLGADVARDGAGGAVDDGPAGVVLGGDVDDDQRGRLRPFRDRLLERVEVAVALGVERRLHVADERDARRRAGAGLGPRPLHREQRVVAAPGARELARVDRARDQRLDRHDRLAALVQRGQADGAVAARLDPDPQRARSGRREPHAAPGERQPRRCVGAAEEPAVQGRVEQRRVHAEARRVLGRLLVERDLGEDLLPQSPRRAQALEGRAVAEARLGQMVVERLGVQGLGPARRPRLPRELAERGVRGRGGDGAARVARPLALGLVVVAGRGRAGVDRDRPAALVVGLGQRDLHLHRALGGEDQRRLERQLLDRGSAGLRPGLERQLDERRARQQHRLEDGVVGEPRVRAQ